MADRRPNPTQTIPANAPLLEALSRIGRKIEDQPLRSWSLARIAPNRHTPGGLRTVPCCKWSMLRAEGVRAARSANG